MGGSNTGSNNRPRSNSYASHGSSNSTRSSRNSSISYSSITSSSSGSSDSNDSSSSSLFTRSSTCSSSGGRGSFEIKLSSPPVETALYEGEELMIVPQRYVQPLLIQVPPSEVSVEGNVIMAWHPSHSSQRDAHKRKSIFSTIQESSAHKNRHNSKHRMHYLSSSRSPSYDDENDHSSSLTQFFSSTLWKGEREGESTPQPSSPSSISTSASSKKKRHNRKQRSGSFSSSLSSKSKSPSSSSSSKRIHLFLVKNLTTICISIVCLLIGTLMIALYLDSDAPVGYNRHDPKSTYQNYYTTTKTTNKRKNRNTNNRKNKPTTKTTTSPRRSTSKNKNEPNNNDGHQAAVEIIQYLNVVEVKDDITRKNRSADKIYKSNSINNPKDKNDYSVDAVFDKRAKLLTLVNNDRSTPYKYGLDDEAADAFITLARRAKETGGEIKIIAQHQSQPEQKYYTYVDKKTNATITKIKGRGGGEQFILAVQPSRYNGLDFQLYNDQADSHEILLCKNSIPPIRSSKKKFPPSISKRYAAMIAAEKKVEEAADNHDTPNKSTSIVKRDIHATTSSVRTTATTDHGKLYQKTGGVCIAGNLSSRIQDKSAVVEQSLCQQQLEKSDKHTVMIPNSPYEALAYIPIHRLGEATATTTDSFTQLMTSSSF